VPFDEYRAWYDRQAAAIEESRQEAPEQREALEAEQGEQATQSGGGAGGASDDQ
jgi:hypothetical protein